MKRNKLNGWKLAPVMILILASQSFAAKDGGGNHGGTDGSHKLFSDWCDSVGGVLDSAKISADMAINLNTDIETGIKDLSNGLKDALKKNIQEGKDSGNQIDLQKSLTYRLLKNGVEIARALEDQGEKAQADEARFLESYYDFIKKTSNSVDKALYVNSIEGVMIDRTRYEPLHSEQLAKRELYWFIKKFTKKMSDNDTENEVVPNGLSGKSFLTIAGLMADAAAHDLGSVELVGYFEPTKEKLEAISVRTSKYIDGDVGQLHDDNYGINHIVVPGIREAIGSIVGECRDEEIFN